MKQNRLIHDAAYAGATMLMEQMQDNIPPEDRKEFHRLAYRVIKATIEGYEMQKGPGTSRISPSPN
jgi:hypothetical protein